MKRIVFPLVLLSVFLGSSFAQDGDPEFKNEQFFHEDFTLIDPIIYPVDDFFRSSQNENTIGPPGWESNEKNSLGVIDVPVGDALLLVLVLALGYVVYLFIKRKRFARSKRMTANKNILTQNLKKKVVTVTPEREDVQRAS